MTNKIKPWIERLSKRIPALKRHALSAAAGIMPVLLPCAAALLLMNFLEALGERYAWMQDAGAFWALVDSILVLPLAAGMITYAVSAFWEHRSFSLNDAVQLVRIRIKPVLITGIAAGAIILVFRWIGSAVSSIIGILPALLGWIPVLGAVISGVVGFVVWLLALVMEFIAHAALVCGMLALTADGMSGRPQLERTISVIWGSRDDTLCDMGLAFGVWVVFGALGWLLGLIPGVLGALAGSIISAALYALSMTAISAVYLAARDKQDGMHFHP